MHKYKNLVCNYFIQTTKCYIFSKAVRLPVSQLRTMFRDHALRRLGLSESFTVQSYPCQTWFCRVPKNYTFSP